MKFFNVLRKDVADMHHSSMSLAGDVFMNATADDVKEFTEQLYNDIRVITRCQMVME